ncbi:MAG: dihydroorotase [Bacteroidetes bacterium]|nr:MAG: dihydroorotase [Bacteroidota bacterium]
MKNSAQILIKNARLVEPLSEFHLQQVDLLLTNGKLEQIAPSISIDNIETFSADNLHVSLGWMDLRANFSDPGMEDREDLESGALAAWQGGFTSVGLSPQTEPVADTKASIHYINRANQNSPVNLLPYGAFSRGTKGEELSEIYDMHKAGALAFSNGKHSVSNSALMKLALLYNRDLKRPLQVQSFDANLRADGQMHEGSKSTWLGLKGLPEISETITQARDIHLAEYCEAALHFNGISCRQSVALLREAQAKSLAISGDVNLMNLLFTDEDLETYDSRLKVFPPLREMRDKSNLVQALKDGVLKGIASNHEPRTIEEKRCEFDMASFGTATLEGFFGALNAALETEMTLSDIIYQISRAPREITHYQTNMAVKAGEEVELTFFNPALEWSWSDLKPYSKAANYPFDLIPLKGKALATYVKGKFSPIA